VADVPGFRGPDGAPEYTASIALRADEGLKLPNGSHAADVRFVIADSTTHKSFQVDTSLTLISSRALREQDAIRTSFTLAAPGAVTPFFSLKVQAHADTTLGRVVGGPVAVNLRMHWPSVISSSQIRLQGARSGADNYLQAPWQLRDVWPVSKTLRGSIRSSTSSNLQMIPRACAHSTT
jgi:hypothetical protein